MDILGLIDDILNNTIEDFENDGMIVNIPNDVKEKLKEEMIKRLCDVCNDIRDDIEMDVRQFAVMNDKEGRA